MKALDPIRLKNNIEARIAKDLAENNISGASVLVRQAEKEVYRQSFGYTAPHGSIPVNDHTVFRLASMTKPITAVAILMLADRGLLTLDDKLADHLPAFSHLAIQNSDGTATPCDVPVTLRHLLTHTSGIAGGKVWGEMVDRMKRENIDTLSHFVDFLATFPLSFRPGTAQEYSPVGAFSLLTAIVEQCSGMTYEEFLQENLFSPCRMTDTTFAPSAEQWSRMITMHDKVNRESQVGATVDGCVFEQFPTTNPLGGAGLVSTLEDYAHFAQMLLEDGVFEGRRILSTEALREMASPQTPQSFHPGKAHCWGLSVRVITNEEYKDLPVGSFGWSGAYGTHFWIDPVNRIFAIYMKNSKFDGGSGAITSANFEKDVAAALV